MEFRIKSIKFINVKVFAFMCALMVSSPQVSFAQFIPGLSALGHAMLGAGRDDNSSNDSSGEIVAVRITRTVTYAPPISERDHCEVIPPGRPDKSGRACEKGTYGVTYLDHYTNQTPCHPSVASADAFMRTLPYCDLPSDSSGCEIQFPGDTDRNNLSCGQNFGVTVSGYLDSNTCYTSVQQAFAHMASIPLCKGKRILKKLAKARGVTMEDVDRAPLENENLDTGVNGAANTDRDSGVKMSRTCVQSITSALEAIRTEISLETACVEGKDRTANSKLKSAIQKSASLFHEAQSLCQAVKEKQDRSLYSDLVKIRTNRLKSGTCAN